ncbi:MAG: ATP-binding protein [Clostridiales bacterium]|nr:ATP-binding protein [Clostridiales bacterium]
MLDSSDMAVILGNLLDNAIEAVKGLEKKDRKIQLKMRYDLPNVSIAVTNPFAGNRKKDSNQNYVTTKEDERNHGLGMKIVKDTVERYQGILEAKDYNNVFITHVLLYDVAR